MYELSAIHRYILGGSPHSTKAIFSDKIKYSRVIPVIVVCKADERRLSDGADDGEQTY